MTTTSTRMTAEQFLAIPEDEGRGLQLIEGEVVVSEARPRHQVTQANLLVALELWRRSDRGHGFVLLPTDVVLDEGNVYAPDVLFVADPTRIDLDQPLYGSPDLAVEVRSPSTWRYDLGAKKRVYERHGLRELWLVDTAAESVLVFRRSAPETPEFDVALELTGDDDLTSPLLPGFALPVARVFPS